MPKTVRTVKRNKTRVCPVLNGAHAARKVLGVRAEFSDVAVADLYDPFGPSIKPRRRR
jgi:hypothetical protein